MIGSLNDAHVPLAVAVMLGLSLAAYLGLVTRQTPSVQTGIRTYARKSITCFYMVPASYDTVDVMLDAAG